MRIGAFFFATDDAMDVVDVGRGLEEHGLESLWLPEHTHIPVSRRTPWPGGGELPRHYKRTLDPFVALGAVAAATSTLRIATGVCLVTQRDPIVTAKAVASLDHLSGGRLLFGVGAGWNREELASHGTDYATRFRLLRERMEAMKRIWTEDESGYAGSLVAFEPLWSWPKPVQKPHPPIVVGGNAPGTLRRVVAYGDEWMPIAGRGRAFEERIPELRELAAEAGRGHIRIGLFGAEPEPAEIERLAGHGVERLVFRLPSAGADEVLPLIREYGRLAETYREEAG